jgi:predicted PurR-regulated permease PerM
LRADAFRWFVRGTGFAVGLALVAAVAGGIVLAAKVLVLILIAVLLGSGLEPFVGAIRSRVALGRGLTILIVYACFFVLVLGLLLLVVPGALDQFRDLGTQLGPVLADARTWASTVQPRALADSLGEIVDLVQRTVRPPTTGPDAEQVIAAGVTVADLAISVVSVLALVFFWLTEHARLQRFALALAPRDRRAGAREAWNEIEARLGAWIRGQLILMGTMGVLTAVAYTVLGLEGALLLGVIAALAEAVPIVGPFLGAIPALLVAAMTGRLELVALVAIVYVVIQLVEGNVLVPLVMKNTIGIPPFLVLASVLAGAAIGGVIGALLAVPITAALTVVLERMQARASPVPLEPATSAATPDSAKRDAFGDSLPDAPGSSSGR